MGHQRRGGGIGGHFGGSLAGRLVEEYGIPRLQLRLQAEGINLPYEALLALPYLVTILVLALTGRNAAYSRALLKPYYREGRPTEVTPLIAVKLPR